MSEKATLRTKYREQNYTKLHQASFHSIYKARTQYTHVFRSVCEKRNDVGLAKNLCSVCWSMITAFSQLGATWSNKGKLVAVSIDLTFSLPGHCSGFAATHQCNDQLDNHTCMYH